MKDRLKITGIFHLKVFVDGVLKNEFTQKNMVVNRGRTNIVESLAEETTGNWIDRIAIGFSVDPPMPTDTIIAEAFIKPIDRFEYLGVGQVRFHWELLPEENNGAQLNNYGLVTENGTLFARWFEEEVIPKRQNVHLIGHWTIII
ncbi:MAG: hypothetical protein FWE02_03870 [Defluviitaleaceae bacterium]|nr:hypothetical protein [Defluviitaleaceae bacterium]